MKFVHLLTPVLAPVHLPIANIGEFYNGMLHPFLVPGHMLAILIAGMLAGQIPSATLHISRSFMGTVLLGLLLAGLGVRLSTQIPLLFGAMIAAVVVSSKPKAIPKSALFVLVGVLGALLGIDSTFDNMTAKAMFWCISGCLISTSFVAFYVALIVKKAKYQWQHIAVRVVASWICAICLLIITLQFVKA